MATIVVQSSVSWSLSAYVEDLMLMGSAAINGTGNDLGNTIKGNSGANLIAGAGGNDTLYGGAGDDILQGGTGNDVIRGGAGKDVIVGGAGVDVLTGDDSVHAADRFLFESAGDSGFGAGNRDVITDFDAYDLIDLSKIDANTLAAGDQAFRYIGAAAFSAAGQLRMEIVKGAAVLEADVNGDRVADFQIELTGVSHLLDASAFLM